jgi:hypothetical protein
METVRRVDRGNVHVDMGAADGMISKFDLIPNESIRKNDRLKAYIKEVKSSPRGAQIFLITCLTICAAMRPNSSVFIGSRTKSSTSTPFASLA